MTLRSVVSVFLVLCLVMTGQVMAQVRTAPDATGQMVLCIGTTSVVVYTDAEGRPTAAPHICPDCVMTGLAGVAHIVASPQQVPCAAIQLGWPVLVQVAPLSCGALLNPRAPPSLI